MKIARKIVATWLIGLSLIGVIGVLDASAQSSRLTVALPYVPNLSDLPQFREPVSRLVFSNLGYSLTTIDAEGRTQLELASELNASSSGKVWSVRVRNDSLFPDGRELKLADVEETLKRVKRSPLNPFFKIKNLQLENTRDPYRMRGTAAGVLNIELDEANPQFDRLLSTIPILNSETARISGDTFGSGTLFGALGPFVLREARPDTGIALQGVNDFFDPNRPQIADLVFQKYSGAREALSALRVGSVDIIPLPTKEQLLAAEGDPTLQIIPSPLLGMAQISGVWELKNAFWSKPTETEDALNTDKMIVRKSLRLDSRAMAKFDLSGAYYPSN